MAELIPTTATAVVGPDPATDAIGAPWPGYEAWRDGLKAGPVASLSPPRVVGRSFSPLWAALIALLAAEVIGLTLRFETGNARGMLPALLLHLRLIFQLLVVIVSVAFLSHVANRGKAAVRPVGPPAGPHCRWPYVLAHFAALASFAGLKGCTRSQDAPRIPV